MVKLARKEEGKRKNKRKERKGKRKPRNKGKEGKGGEERGRGKGISVGRYIGKEVCTKKQKCLASFQERKIFLSPGIFDMNLSVQL